jgi:hypothetical protein
MSCLECQIRPTFFPLVSVMCGRVSMADGMRKPPISHRTALPSLGYNPVCGSHRDTLLCVALVNMMILFMAAKKGHDILFCMPNRNQRILLVSVVK